MKEIEGLCANLNLLMKVVFDVTAGPDLCLFFKITMKSNRVITEYKCGACRAVSRFRDPSLYSSYKYNLLTGFCIVFIKHKGY